MQRLYCPLQASSVLIKADRRRAYLVSPLPPTTKKQILRGELFSLLVEEDYNLSTMVSKFSKKIIIILHIPTNFTGKIIYFLSINFHASFISVVYLGFKMRVFYASFLFDVENSIKCPPSSQFYVLISV